MTTKRSGTWQLACGHQVTGEVDTTKRQKCPTCKRDTIVTRRVTT